MEASKLVFVFVKDAKPKRKSAVPIPDGYTWADFTQQVKAKLKIAGVKEILLASSGQKVTSLDELQDIDELCVVEGQELYSNGLAASSSADGRHAFASTSTEILPQGQADVYQQAKPDHSHHKVAMADGEASSSRHRSDDDSNKYTRRAHPVKRLLQRLFPSMFVPSLLPVSSKDLSATDDRPQAGPQGARRVRRRRSPFSVRNVLMLLAVVSCFATMVWFFFKATMPST